MPRIEMRMPSPEDYPNDPLGYVTAIFDAQEQYRKDCFAAIDRCMSTSGTRREPSQPKFERTIHDYLQDHPELLKRYKQIGPLALLEI